MLTDLLINYTWFKDAYDGKLPNVVFKGTENCFFLPYDFSFLWLQFLTELKYPVIHVMFMLGHTMSGY